jgi:hypothetical protein
MPRTASVQNNDTVKVEPTATKRAKKEHTASNDLGGSVVPSADKKEPASSVKKKPVADKKKQTSVPRINEQFCGISNGMVSKGDSSSLQDCLGLNYSTAREFEGTVSPFNADVVNKLIKQADALRIIFSESMKWNEDLLTLASKAPSASSALVHPEGVSILVASSSLHHGSGGVFILTLALTLTLTLTLTHTLTLTLTLSLILTL